MERFSILNTNSPEVRFSNQRSHCYHRNGNYIVPTVGSFCKIIIIMNNYNNLSHLNITFLGTQSALHSKGGISSSTTSVKHPPGRCNGSHIVPERSPHTSLLVERRQSDEANQCMGMIKRP